eukprot:COSAG01_NODE_38221_length_492_cov_1.310433_1_plen_110_part_10
MSHMLAIPSGVYLHIEGCSFSLCSSQGGGALYAELQSRVIVLASTFKNNLAEFRQPFCPLGFKPKPFMFYTVKPDNSNGGAISANDVILSVKDSHFTGNDAKSEGIYERC